MAGNRLALKVTGIAELAQAARNYGRAVVDDATRDAERIATAMTRAQRAAAPVDTGTLRDSIVAEVELDPYGARVTGRARARHASFVEHGTEDTPKQPFFYDHAIRARRQLSEAQARAVRERAPAGLGTPTITGTTPLPQVGGGDA